MKLIIDIPEESYKYIKTMSERGWLTSPEDANATMLTCSDYVNAILNSTPLDDVKAEIAEEICLTDNPYTKETKYTIEHLKLLDILDNIGKAESEGE